MSSEDILNNNSVCYQGIQRVFRNAVVELIRSRMTDAFGPQAIDKLMAPFQKEWNRIVEDAKCARERGDLSAQIVDEFDYLGVNHFYNLFESYYKVLVPTTQPPSTTTSKPTLLGVSAGLRERCFRRF